MRNAAVLAIGVALLLVQGNLFRLLGFLPLAGTTPNLILPLVLFLGVHESSMARGALLSFVLGYTTDLFGSAPIGLFTFTSVAVWWLSRVAAVRLSAQTLPTQMVLALVFAVVESVIILTLLTIFGQDPQRPVEIARTVLPHALSTALFAPFVFRIAHKLHQGALAPKPGEGRTP
jgi:rod shape-determining protein MreD